MALIYGWQPKEPAKALETGEGLPEQVCFKVNVKQMVQLIGNKVGL